MYVCVCQSVSTDPTSMQCSRRPEAGVELQVFVNPQVDAGK